MIARSNAFYNKNCLMETIKKEKSILENEVVYWDPFCWLCHKNVDRNQLSCKHCQRSYHLTCVKETQSNDSFICQECKIIENHSHLSHEKLNQMIYLIFNRIKEYFMQYKISNLDFFPNDHNLIVKPMNLNNIESNIQLRVYKNPKQFYSDIRYFYHNFIIFHGKSVMNSELKYMITNIKKIEKICKDLVCDLEICSTCFENSQTHHDSWFVTPCPKLHTLVWAKQSDGLYWPGKIVRAYGAEKSNDTMFDVRIFGKHKKIWIPGPNLFYMSLDSPNKNKVIPTNLVSDYNQSINELNVYITNIETLYKCQFPFESFKEPINPHILNNSNLNSESHKYDYEKILKHLSNKIKEIKQSKPNISNIINKMMKDIKQESIDSNQESYISPYESQPCKTTTSPKKSYEEISDNESIIGVSNDFRANVVCLWELQISKFDSFFLENRNFSTIYIHHHHHRKEKKVCKVKPHNPSSVHYKESTFLNDHLWSTDSNPPIVIAGSFNAAPAALNHTVLSESNPKSDTSLMTVNIANVADAIRVFAKPPSNVENIKTEIACDSNNTETDTQNKKIGDTTTSDDLEILGIVDQRLNKRKRVEINLDDNCKNGVVDTEKKVDLSSANQVNGVPDSKNKEKALPGRKCRKTLSSVDEVRVENTQIVREEPIIEKTNSNNDLGSKASDQPKTNRTCPAPTEKNTQDMKFDLCAMKNEAFAEIITTYKIFYRSFLDDIRRNHEYHINQLKLNHGLEMDDILLKCNQKIKFLEEQIIVNKRKQWCINCLKEATCYCCVGVWYCGQQCQIEHWKVHQTHCVEYSKTKKAQKSNNNNVVNVNTVNNTLNGHQIVGAGHHAFITNPSFMAPIPNGSNPLSQMTMLTSNMPYPTYSSNVLPYLPANFTLPK